MKITYYRIFRDLDRPGMTTGAFRTLEDDETYAMERFDPETGTWSEDHASLAGYLFNGEPGAERVADADVAEMLSRIVAIPF